MKIRKYLRQPLIQTALLKLPNNEEIPCEIRNFCQAGLFLKLAWPGAIDESQKQADGAEVVFISYRAASIFHLGGRLSHVSRNGAGMVFDRPPAFEILQALQEVALGDPLAESSLPAEQAGIQERCVQALESTLRTHLESLPAQIGKLLQNEWDLEPIDAPELSQAADAPPSPEGQAKLLVERFCTYALEQAKNFVVPDLSLQPESGAIYTESPSQRVIFKDWMNLMDKIIHLESKYDGVLKELEGHFSVLAQRDIANHNNPFGPSVLLHTLHYAMKEETLTNAQRETVYEAATRLLDEGLDTLYRELRILTKPLEDLMLNLSLENNPPADFPGHDEPSNGALPAKPDEEWQGVGSSNLPRQSAQFLPGPKAAPLPWSNPLAGTIHQRSLAPPPPVGTGIPVAMPHQPDAFTAFVVLTRYAEGQAGKGEGEADADFDRFEVIGALTKQLQAANREPELPYFSAPKLQADLGQIFAETGQEKALFNGKVKENLQILGLLLDTILVDQSTPACIAPYIMKLQIPLLIASFADPGLLYGKTHPGREILNQLDYLAQAANPQGEFDNPQLRQSLDALFDRLIKEVANKPQVFADVLKGMEKLTAPLLKAYTTRLERLVDACEGGQRLAHARQMVDREIDTRIGGKTIPSVVLSLLDAGWRQLLVLTNLRQGTGHDDWRRQLASIDLLISWLAKPGPATPPSQANIKGLKTYLREGLSGINAEPVEVNQVLEKIEKLLPEDGSEPIPAAMVEIPPPDTAKMERENALKYRLAGFRVGDWLKFASTQNTWIPLRLAWIGQEPGRFVFTNRKGVKTLELDAAKLAQVLDEKRASRIESLDGLPLVERTAKSLLSTLRDRLR